MQQAPSALVLASACSGLHSIHSSSTQGVLLAMALRALTSMPLHFHAQEALEAAQLATDDEAQRYKLAALRFDEQSSRARWALHGGLMCLWCCTITNVACQLLLLQGALQCHSCMIDHIKGVY
jgi:hypothetical protein